MISMVIMNIQTCVNVFPDSIKTDSRTSHVESEPTGPSVAPVWNQQPPSHCQDSPHPGHSTQLQGEGHHTGTLSCIYCTSFYIVKQLFHFGLPKIYFDTLFTINNDFKAHIYVHCFK